VGKTWYILLVTGLLFLLGILSERIARLVRIPRVTILLILGIIIGPSGFNIVHQEVSQWYPMLADITLVMVGFLLGGKFTLPKIRSYGKKVITLSLIEAGTTVAVVFAGLLLVGINGRTALLLSAIAAATAPAATLEVIRESGKPGEFTRVLEGAVALDDVWGLVLFSIFIAVGQYFTEQTINASVILHGIWEIVGAILVGGAIGYPVARFSGFITPGKLTLIESLGYIFICAGISLKLGVSFLLAAMVMGAIVTNFAEKKDQQFKMVDQIEWPFIVTFFIIAGASMELSEIKMIGFTGAAYIILRSLGKIAGGFTGASIAGIKKGARLWTGVALLPQAGVAIGMALVAANTFPEQKEKILSLVIGTTIFFEITGSIATLYAIKKVKHEEHNHRNSG